MRRVVIESPYAGDVERNLRYVRACMKDCLKNGEAPFASHALYTQEGVLDDTKPEERKLGMEAGFCITEDFALTAIYTDLGISSGMLEGIKRSVEAGRPFEERQLGEDWDKKEQNGRYEIDINRIEMLPLDENQFKGKELVDKLVEKTKQSLKFADKFYEKNEPEEAVKIYDQAPLEALKTQENFEAWLGERAKNQKFDIQISSPKEKELAYLTAVELKNLQSEVEAGAVKFRKIPIIEEPSLNVKQRDQEIARLIKVANAIIGTPEFKGNEVQVYWYSMNDYTHLAVVSKVAKTGLTEKHVWDHLHAYTDADGNKIEIDRTWLICLTPEEWERYMDRDLYHKEFIISGTSY